jgi:hypothetical protein
MELNVGVDYSWFYHTSRVLGSWIFLGLLKFPAKGWKQEAGPGPAKVFRVEFHETYQSYEHSRGEVCTRFRQEKNSSVDIRWLPLVLFGVHCMTLHDNTVIRRLWEVTGAHVNRINSKELQRRMTGPTCRHFQHAEVGGAERKQPDPNLLGQDPSGSTLVIAIWPSCYSTTSAHCIPSP